jgi:antitoxin component YwqK of YwqJK toxin-antitoxin module
MMQSSLFLRVGLYEELDTMGKVIKRGLSTYSYKHSVEKRKNTSLSDGLWFVYLYYYSGSRLEIFETIDVKNNKLNGFLSRFSYGKVVTEVEKYKNGILVDTLKGYDSNGRLYRYEVRNSDGGVLYEVVFLYKESGRIKEYTNYPLGYRFTFYPNGNLKSYVRHFEGWEIGEEVIFNESGEVIERVEHGNLDEQTE